jgi:hypothetical protein
MQETILRECNRNKMMSYYGYDGDNISNFASHILQQILSLLKSIRVFNHDLNFLLEKIIVNMVLIQEEGVQLDETLLKEVYTLYLLKIGYMSDSICLAKMLQIIGPNQSVIASIQ